MPNRPVALLDACVLYPARLRDLLITLSVSGAFIARWSAHVHEEWIRAVLARNMDNPGVTRKKLERTRSLMDAAIQDVLVTGYEPLIPKLQLPDPNDRHILAAAIRCGAGLIVTFNLKHFPDKPLAKFGVRAEHPDQFIARLLGADALTVCSAARQHRARLKKPPLTADDYLASLAQSGIPQTVAALRRLRGIL